MISVAKISGGGNYSGHLSDQSKAAEYYVGEDVPSEWKGTGAEMQSLSGEVREADLLNQMAGRIEDATGMRDMQHDSGRARPDGWDVTISAPKSLSIEAIIHENPDAMDMHKAGVEAVLSKIEEYATARVTQDGKTTKEETGNITVANFTHVENRNGDPQLHDHNLVMNHTICEDGKARSLDSKESIYKHSAELTETYRQAVEQRAQELGYSTYRDEKGAPQLAGYERDAMKEFSTRSQEIEKALEARGLTRETATPHEKEVACLDTRQAKAYEPHSRAEAQAEYQGRIEGKEGAGPALKGEEARAWVEQYKSEIPQREESFSKTELQAARSIVNDAAAAEARLASKEPGAVWDNAHRQELERRVEDGKALQAERPDLYERAAAEVEKRGVKDADARIEAAAMARVQEKMPQTDQSLQDLKALESAKDAGGTAAQIVAGVANEVKDAEQVKKEIEKAEKAREEKIASEQGIAQAAIAGAVNLKSDGNSSSKPAETIAVALKDVGDNAGAGIQQQVEARLQEALREGKITTEKDAAAFIKAESEKMQGRGELHEKEVRAELEKKANLGETAMKQSTVDAAQEAKAELAKMDKEKQIAAEKIDAMINKWGSAAQREEARALRQKQDEAEKDMKAPSTQPRSSGFGMGE